MYLNTKNGSLINGKEINGLENSQKMLFSMK